jgi:hypothetical protein
MEWPGSAAGGGKSRIKGFDFAFVTALVAVKKNHDPASLTRVALARGCAA